MIINFLDAVEYDERRIMVAVEVTDAGETKKLAHLIPKDTVEWRIAEYDLDPWDVETALDIVLFEPHVTIPKEHGLFRAATVADARSALLSAVRGKRQNSESEMAAQGKGRADEAAAKNREIKDKVARMSWVDLNTVNLKREQVLLLRSRPEKRMTMEELNKARHLKGREIRERKIGG